MNGSPPAHAWWSRLRHQGLLLSPVVMIERYPSAPPSASWYAKQRLRSAHTRFATTLGDGDQRDQAAVLALVDALVENFIGHPASRLARQHSIPEKVTVAIRIGSRWETLRPHRILYGDDNAQTPALLVMADSSPHVGRGWETLQQESMEFFTEDDPLYRTYGKQAALERQKELFAADSAIKTHWEDFCSSFAATTHWIKECGDPFGVSLSRGNHEKSLQRDWTEARSRRLGFADGVHPFTVQGSGKTYSYKAFLEVAYRLWLPAAGWASSCRPASTPMPAATTFENCS